MDRSTSAQLWPSDVRRYAKRAAIVMGSKGGVAEFVEGALHHAGFAVLVSRSYAHGVEMIREGLDFLCCDIAIGGDETLRLFEKALEQRPVPVLTAIGRGEVGLAFRLGSLGVRHLLEGEADLVAAKEAIGLALREPPRIDGVVVSCVGRYAAPDVQALVRGVMLEQALAMASGNRTRAASILGISRQAIQQAIRLNPRGRLQEAGRGARASLLADVCIPRPSTAEPDSVGMRRRRGSGSMGEDSASL